jgi:hypothetical protein
MVQSRKCRAERNVYIEPKRVGGVESVGECVRRNALYESALLRDVWWASRLVGLGKVKVLFEGVEDLYEDGRPRQGYVAESGDSEKVQRVQDAWFSDFGRRIGGILGMAVERLVELVHAVVLEGEMGDVVKAGGEVEGVVVNEPLSLSGYIALIPSCGGVQVWDAAWWNGSPKGGKYRGVQRRPDECAASDVQLAQGGNGSENRIDRGCQNGVHKF